MLQELFLKLLQILPWASLRNSSRISLWVFAKISSWEVLQEILQEYLTDTPRDLSRRYLKESFGIFLKWFSRDSLIPSGIPSGTSPGIPFGTPAFRDLHRNSCSAFFQEFFEKFHQRFSQGFFLGISDPLINFSWRIIVGVQKNNVWQRNINNELSSLYGESGIQKGAEAGGLCWIEHEQVRMPGSNFPVSIRHKLQRFF